MAVSGSVVLIVDDDPRFTAVVSKPLERAGYRVVTALNGAAALALAALGVLSMAIVDLCLNNENGLDLIAHLRQLQPDLPCVLWSGMLSASVQREAQRRGVLCFDKASDSISFHARRAASRWRGCTRRRCFEGGSTAPLLRGTCGDARRCQPGRTCARRKPFDHPALLAIIRRTSVTETPNVTNERRQHCSRRCA